MLKNNYWMRTKVMYHIPQIADCIKTEHTRKSPARITESIFEIV